jgi:hypothetical protein
MHLSTCAWEGNWGIKGFPPHSEEPPLSEKNFYISIFLSKSAPRRKEWMLFITIILELSIPLWLQMYVLLKAIILLKIGNCPLLQDHRNPWHRLQTCRAYSTADVGWEAIHSSIKSLGHAQQFLSLVESWSWRDKTSLVEWRDNLRQIEFERLRKESDFFGNSLLISYYQSTFNTQGDVFSNNLKIKSSI